MFYRSNIFKEFQEHISKLNAIDLYNLLQDKNILLDLFVDDILNATIDEIQRDEVTD